MSFEIQEDPTKGTSGLTSATQIIDVTDGVAYSISNTTSANEGMVALTLKPSKQTIEKQKFKEAVRRSITKDISILKELSKY